MKQCKTCKHYKPEEEHICSSPLVIYGYGFRDKTKEVDQRGMYVEDDEGWGFIPGPDFGCINHEDES